MGIEALLSRLSALIPADAAWTQGGNEGRGNFRCENCVACEDCKFCRDCQQCRACTYCEACEQCEGCTQCRRSIACSGCSYLEDSRACRNSSYLLLCLDCEDSVHCLGCVGLSGAEFCILNEQVSRQAYFSQVRELRDEIAALVDQGWRIDQLNAAPSPSDSPHTASAEPSSSPAKVGGEAALPSPAPSPSPHGDSAQTLTRDPLEEQSTAGSLSRPTASGPEARESQTVAAQESQALELSPADAQRALAIEQEAERLALAASRSFEARLARLQTSHPASPRPPSNEPKIPLWRSRIQGSASSTSPTSEDAAAHPARSAYRDLVPTQSGERTQTPDPMTDQESSAARDSDRTSPSEAETRTGRSDVAGLAPFAQAEIGEPLDWHRRERYRQASVEQGGAASAKTPNPASAAHDQLRARPLPHSRGPASWRAPRGDRDPGVKSPSSWVPRGALSERERPQPEATPNRLLAFVKSGAAPLSGDEDNKSPAWTRAKLPPRKKR